MASLTEPYEDPIDISYKQTPQGVVRVRSAEVKPYRRWELKLLAQGIPIVYHGTAKGHARPESTGEDHSRPSELKHRPLWAANQTGRGRPLSSLPHKAADVLAAKYGANAGTKLAGV